MKSTVISSLIGISAAWLMVGCASSDYDETDYTVTETTRTTESEMAQTSGSEITEASGAERPIAAQAGDEWVIPLHEEQLNVGKRSVDSGEVTIRKVVTSEPVTQSVELRRETLSIEREPAGASSEAASASSAAGSGLFEEDAITIQLQEEQPVVEKTIVQTGQVRARKDAQLEQREVQGEVRREDVQVDRSADTADLSSPEIEEAAGAELPDENKNAEE